jgi:protein CpxP
MFFFHRFGRHHHDHGHPHHHHGHHGHHGIEGGWRGEYLIGKMAAKLGRRLDLDAQQQEKLRGLLHSLQLQREALKGGSAREELSGLLAQAQFNREGALGLLEARLNSVREGGPALVAALGDFFDALDADQQQALRFMLRPRRFGRC